MEICIAEYVINKNKDFNKIPFGELINKIIMSVKQEFRGANEQMEHN